MDEKNHQLLQLLQKNSRYSNVELADMLGVSETDIDHKLNHLIETGIIRQFTTVINDNHIDDTPIKALVELSIRPEKNTGYDSIAKRIYGYPRSRVPLFGIWKI